MNFAELFYQLENRVYLDAANQGPLPKASIQAVEQALELKKFPERITNRMYFDGPDLARTRIAELIRGDPSEIALTTGASTGIQIVASSLDLKPGDEAIIAADEFPAIFYPWDQAQSDGLIVHWIRPKHRFLTAEDYLAQITKRTRLIAASHVSYANGNLIDLRALGEACRQRGIALLVDGSQAVGAIPINVRELNIDFLACCGYKWLLSPYGTGFFYVRSDWIGRLRPPPAMWQAVKGADNFNELPRKGWQLSEHARRWDVAETASFLNIAAMAESLKLLLTVGTSRIQQHIRALITCLLSNLPAGITLVSPEDEERRGPFACVASRSPAETRTIWERSRAAAVHVSLRENALRVSPHIYNSEADIHKLIECVSL